MNITWAATVLAFKKVGLFLKNYGVLILLGCALVYAIIFAKNKQDMYNGLLKQMQEQIQAHNQQVDALEKVHEEEVQRYHDIEQKYNETLQRIQLKYEEALAQLDNQKKKELHNIIEQTHNNPDEMATRVNSLFGLPIYQPPTQ